MATQTLFPIFLFREGVYATHNKGAILGILMGTSNLKLKTTNLPNDSTILNTTPSTTSWTFSSMVTSRSGTSGRS